MPSVSAELKDRFTIWAWVALLAVLAFLALIPVNLQAQALSAMALLTVLALCHHQGRRATSLRARSLWRLSVIMVCTFLSLRYMHWRATESLPLQFGLAAMIGGLLLFMAEAWSFVNTLLGYIINSEPFFRRYIPLKPDDDLPHVDVYIPTYNEDAAIVRPTVIAATQLDYPREKLHVWILDDGGTAQKLGDKDPEKADAARARAGQLKALAERFGAGYLTRERNEHAKAGNINSALKHTSGDLLLVLDCDHIPAADFLQRTVGFFLEDPKLFVLQTPHNFVSPDPIERNLGTHAASPAENELFYDVMQPGLDFWGTSFFCGSAAVLRRSVIDELGGISGKTITEDAETTLDALSLGYKSAYYNRPMVSGLQPETFTGFIVQRVRWGQGMLQIFILKNPWRQPRLSLMQRVLYTNFAVYWGFAGARLIMLLAPPAYLLLGINLCDTTSEQLIAYAGPALIASLVSTQFFYGRVRWPFMSQLYEVVQSIFVVRGMWLVIRKPESPAFKVTPKGEVLDHDFLSTLSWPFYVLLAVTVGAVVVGVQRYDAESWNRGAIAFVLFWAVLDVVLLLGALGITLERRQLRSEPRAPHREAAGVLLEGQSWQGHTLNASASGLGLVLETWTGTQALSSLVGQTVYAEFLGRGRAMEGTVQSARWLDAHSVALGIKYTLSTIEDERLAVEIAFGSSGILLANNRERHQGQGILRALLAMALHATRPGLAHLAFLERRLWRGVRGAVRAFW